MGRHYGAPKASFSHLTRLPVMAIISKRQAAVADFDEKPGQHDEINLADADTHIGGDKTQAYLLKVAARVALPLCTAISWPRWYFSHDNVLLITQSGVADSVPVSPATWKLGICRISLK